jgi:hypothetical protein
MIGGFPFAGNGSEEGGNSIGLRSDPAVDFSWLGVATAIDRRDGKV